MSETATPTPPEPTQKAANTPPPSPKPTTAKTPATSEGPTTPKPTSAKQTPDPELTPTTQPGEESTGTVVDDTLYVGQI